MLIDPAVNLVFDRMKVQLADYKEKLEQAQSDLSAWKFTPDRLAGYWKIDVLQFQKNLSDELI